MSYFKEDKCGLYKYTKENRKGRMKLIARFKNVDNLLKWYDGLQIGNVAEFGTLNYL